VIALDSLHFGARSGWAAHRRRASRACADAPHLAQRLVVASGVAPAHPIAAASLRSVARSGCTLRCRYAPRACADAPHFAQRLVVASGVAPARPIAADSLRFVARSDYATRRRYAPRACAIAPHLARLAAARLERAWPAASAAFIGGPAAPSTTLRDRQAPEKPEAEGKIKGRGTVCREKPVCTWGRRGTRRWPAPCRAVQVPCETA